MLISFLLPVYNVSNYIDDCIQSIVNQNIMGRDAVYR